MTTLEERVSLLEKQVGALLSKQPADAREMSGERGDPEVRKDPKDWTGPSMVGRHMSQCPAEFLDLLAAFYDWRAGKEDAEGKMWTSKDGSKSKPTSEFTRRDARLARGWAERNRGRAEQVPAVPAGGETDDIPF